MVTMSDCIIWRGSTVKGYGNRRYNGRNQYVHRIAWAEKHGAMPTSSVHIHHKCGNTLCHNADHLEAISAGAHTRYHHAGVTRTDKTVRKISMARAGKCTGTSNGRAKLTEDAVAEIRTRRSATGCRYADLAEEFGVSAATICRVIRQENWRTV